MLNTELTENFVYETEINDVKVSLKISSTKLGNLKELFNFNEYLLVRNSNTSLISSIAKALERTTKD